jgi:hypothetical protein
MILIADITLRTLIEFDHSAKILKDFRITIHSLPPVSFLKYCSELNSSIRN